MDPLSDGGYPALHEAADSASLRGQKHYIRALIARLGGLLIAALGGGVIVSVGAVAAGGWIALLGFVVALMAELYTSVTKPDRAWYEGRAAAESAKTLAWRYAVKGDSFEAERESRVDAEFLDRIREILVDLHDVDLAEAATSEQITTKMREIRAENFAARKRAYREGRIEDQRSWYSRKAECNRSVGHAWGIAAISAEGLGIVGGVLLITGAVSIDLIGLFAAAAATIAAWTQAKQYKNLGTAYGITAQELAGVKSELDAIDDEARWARFVGEAEEAISREHTLWRASRGLRIQPRGTARALDLKWQRNS